MCVCLFVCLPICLRVCAAPQGVTFRVEKGELVIARILHGGMIDQQGLLHVGDIIKEVNGREVGNDPSILQEVLQEASGSVVLKILPSYQEALPPPQVKGRSPSLSHSISLTLSLILYLSLSLSFSLSHFLSLPLSLSLSFSISPSHSLSLILSLPRVPLTSLTA